MGDEINALLARRAERSGLETAAARDDDEMRTLQAPFRVPWRLAGCAGWGLPVGRNGWGHGHIADNATRAENNGTVARCWSSRWAERVWTASCIEVDAWDRRVCLTACCASAGERSRSTSSYIVSSALPTTPSLASMSISNLRNNF